MSLLLDLLGYIIGGAIVEGAGKSSRKGRARRLATAGELRCGLRAIEGRVYNMGTEWSTGKAIVTAGHLSFVPSMGIVGDRQIDVSAIGPSSRPSFGQGYVFEGALVCLLDTPKGQLEWAV